MIKADLFSFEGKKKEVLRLPKEYEEKLSRKLFTQAIHVYEDRMHLGLARAKTRGEVAISTRKIYRQKGTGGARHGAKSAPIFVGGGVAHGPKGIKRILRLSKTQKKNALLSSINLKAKNSKLAIIEDVGKLSKTSDALKLIRNVSAGKNWKDHEKILFSLSKKNENAGRALRNIKGLTVYAFSDLNAYKVFVNSVLIIDKDAMYEKDVIKDKTAGVKDNVGSAHRSKKNVQKKVKVSGKKNKLTREKGNNIKK